jgi:serine/threonine protein kinase
MSDQPEFDSSHYYALPVGTDLFEFRIERVLGHGGFGITYLATDTHLDERVAIKEFMPNEIAVRVSDSTVRAKSKADSDNLEQGLDSFLEEARTLARFRHRNIVHVRRFFRLHGTAYIVLEYEYGQTLAQYLETQKMDNDRLGRLLSDVLDGLDAVHTRATLHRDLKPSNIILRPDESPVLIDFGAARNFQSRNSMSVTAIATAGYSPPEQYIGGQQGPWTDLYALGAIAYRIVSGNTPPDSLRRLRKDPLVPASSLDVDYDPALLRTIDWMLKVDESERPISVEAVRASLGGATFEAGQNTVGSAASGPDQKERAASDDQGSSEDDSPVKTSTEDSRRADKTAWRGIFAITALLVLAISGMLFYIDLAKQSPPRSPVASSTMKPPAISTVVPTTTAAPPSSYYTDRLSEARYDEQKLKALLVQCSGAPSCATSVTSVINDRLSIIERENRQFTAAQTPAEYGQYLSGCVACSYRDLAQAQMKKVVPPPTLPPPVAEAPKPERWNAVAHVIYKTRGQSRVAAGYSGIRSSPEEARRSAKSACESNSDGHDCVVSEASNSGCYYIQIGNNPVRWASAGTIEEAQRRCNGRGSTRCTRAPLGGCID